MFDDMANDFISVAHQDSVNWARDLMQRNPMDWVILDTETTGLGDLDQIVQVAMINGAGDVLMNNVLVKPTIQIPPGAIRIHGITNEMVEGAPSLIPDVWLEIHKHMQSRSLVIYNANYDLRMLKQSADAHHYTVDFPCSSWSCAMDMYAAWVGDWNDYRGSFKWQKLPGGDHSALGDCRATLRLIEKMAEKTLAEQALTCQHPNSDELLDGTCPICGEPREEQ